MGQSWSSRAAKYPTYERRRKKSASKSERNKENIRTDAGNDHQVRTNSHLRRRDGQAISNRTTPRSHQSDHRQTPPRLPHHLLAKSAARTTKEGSLVADRNRKPKEAPKKPESDGIKSNGTQKSDTKHNSVSRKDSHQTHREMYRPEDKHKRECMVCTDTLSLHRFHDRPPTRDCKHGADVCRRCLRTWIKSEFSTKMWDDIKCPSCLISMKSADMRDSAPKEIFKRYMELYNRTKKEAQPGFRWCNLKGCKSGQVHFPQTPKFRCDGCERTSCVVHNMKWHKGETCREYDHRTNANIKAEEEEASKKLLAATTKQCPGCKRPIEKNMGCDHMECTKCRLHFCWACLLPYRSDVSRRARDAGGGKCCECYIQRA